MAELPEISVVLEPGAKMPVKATVHSAGYDLYFWNPERKTMWLGPGESARFDTGVSIAIPVGYEGQIRSRSGMAFVNRIEAFHGTIDSDFRGTINVLLTNHSSEAYGFKVGERIAQLVINQIPAVRFREVDALPRTLSARIGGFGSTGR